MKTFTKSGHKTNKTLVGTAGQPMEHKLLAEVQSLHQEIREPRGLLVPVFQGAAPSKYPFPKESPTT